MYSLKKNRCDFNLDFKELFKMNETYLYLKANIAYENEYYNHKLEHYVVELYKDKEIFAISYFTLDQEKNLSFFNRPVKIFWNSSCTSDDVFELSQLFSLELDKSLNFGEVKSLKLEFDQHLFSSFQHRSVQLNYALEALIDLKNSEQLIRRGFRKRYRPLINWGLKKMEFLILDNKNADYTLFEKFRMFHFEIAGRVTKSKEAWDAHYEMIRNGHGFIVLAFLENALVSGVLVIHGQKEAYYGVGVNNRNLMSDKLPISHATMNTAIFHAKK
jgi:hypothetical protein